MEDGVLDGDEPALPTVKTSVRDAGAPNQVSSPLEPSSRVSDRTDRRPAAGSAGSGSTACPATWRTVSADALAPVTVATCTTHGHGTGGSDTGSFLLKTPLASVVTARPSALAQELVPPITPARGRRLPADQHHQQGVRPPPAPRDGDRTARPRLRRGELHTRPARRRGRRRPRQRQQEQREHRRQRRDPHLAAHSTAPVNSASVRGSWATSSSLRRRCRRTRSSAPPATAAAQVPVTAPHGTNRVDVSAVSWAPPAAVTVRRRSTASRVGWPGQGSVSFRRAPGGSWTGRVRGRGRGGCRGRRWRGRRWSG